MVIEAKHVDQSLLKLSSVYTVLSDTTIVVHMDQIKYRVQDSIFHGFKTVSLLIFHHEFLVTENLPITPNSFWEKFLCCRLRKDDSMISA